MKCECKVWIQTLFMWNKIDFIDTMENKTGSLLLLIAIYGLHREMTEVHYGWHTNSLMTIQIFCCKCFISIFSMTRYVAYVNFDWYKLFNSLTRGTNNLQNQSYRLKCCKTIAYFFYLLSGVYSLSISKLQFRWLKHLYS